MEDGSSLFTKVDSSSDFSNSIEVATKELVKKDGRSKLIYHGHTCRAVSELNEDWFVPRDGPQSALLHALGPGSALEVIGVNMSSSSSKGAVWLEHEVVKLLSDDQLERVLWEQCAPPPGHAPISHLSVQQNMLLKTLTRLPDLVSSRRGRSLNSALYPNVYYRNLANVIDCCLKKVVDSIRNSNDVSIAFLAALVAKCSLIGDRDSFWATLCPLLEEATLDSPLWQRVSQSLVSRVPDQSLESVLTGIMKFVSLSLSSPSPLYRILGTLPLNNSHAKFLLTQKFTCTRPFDEPRILLGYFNSSNDLRCFIAQVLLNSLPLWSDPSVLKRMSVYHHYRLTGIIAMATTCYVWEKSDKKVNSELQRLSMRGIQAHLDSPVETIRVRGMVLGEHLMARLHPSSGEDLEFTYDSQSEDVKWLKSLMEPLSEQEKHLESQRAKKSTASKDNITPKTTSTITTESHVQYGVGVARVNSCPDDDSDDDDLQPYDMSNDPDSAHSKSPRYLRTCMQDLLSKDHDKSSTALLSLKDILNKSSQDDLREVCVELTKMLLHIDTLVDNIETRMNCLVLVTTKCPKEVAPYLCEQFYSPHYNLRQRMEILDVISKSAVDLSSPPKTERKIEELAPRGLKPWQQIVEDRIKAKTRIISRGPSRPVSQPVQNRFSSVCGLFFFPLMVHYDQRMNTLDLQGRDSFVLGHILNTLGTVLQCAAHTPPLLPMATALLDFCWTLKHHSDTCVRRGVLYCLCCVLSASSLFHSELMDIGLNEMLLWAKDVVADDPDNECRQLAGMSLSLHYSHINQQILINNMATRVATPIRTGLATESSPVFMLMATGQIESAEFPEFDELYCNYSFVYGQDWAVLSGNSEGITQTTHRNRQSEYNFIWNFPIDVSFKSTNPHGWPKVVISVYGSNTLGRDEVRGYGMTHLPITQGRHSVDVNMFVPEPTSQLQKLISWAIGPRPEFIDPKFVAQGEGREITRVASQGSVRINVNIVLKDFVKQGFTNGSSTLSCSVHS